MNVDELLEEIEHKASAIPSSAEVCGLPVEVSDDDDDEIPVADDEDFWEALELLKISRRAFQNIIKYADSGLTSGRKRLLERHCDDIAQFLDNFGELEDKEKPNAS